MTQQAIPSANNPSANRIVVRTSSTSESQNAMDLLGCSFIEKPLVQTNQAGAAHCLKAIETAASNGWAGNFPKILQSLRQVAFTATNSDDNLQFIAEDINGVAIKKRAEVVDFGNGRTIDAFCRPLNETGPQCFYAPISTEEIKLVMMPELYGNITTTMNPRRALPLPPATKAMMGFLSAHMSPENYTTSIKTPDGKDVRKPDGQLQRMTVEQTAQGIKREDNVTELKEKVLKCMTNAQDADCALAATRYGLVHRHDNRLNYDGSKFLGKTR